MTHYSRGDWKARPARARYKLDPAGVRGIALHWPAMTTRLTTPAQVMAALRSWQSYHMDAKNWSDIAYQVAVDQDGNSYVLRGHAHRSGANGDADVNLEYGALLLVLAPGEKPTKDLIQATRDQIARHRQLYPSSHRIVGHNQIRPEATACPGPIVQALIKQGAFDPQETTK